MRAVAVLLTSLLLLLPARGAGQSALTHEESERLDSIALTAMRAAGLPGLSYTVARNGVIVRERGFGLADIENGVTVTPSTVFPIASLSKAITGVAAFQLVDRGRLDLDAPVQAYMPEYPAAEPPMTMRHLLWHSSGIRHYRTEVDEDEEYANRRHFASLADAVVAFANDSLLHPPGRGISYSSFAYTLAGRVIEVASGASFIDYVRTNVFEPAGMHSSRAHDPRAIVPMRARGYKLVDGELRNAEFVDPSNRLPAGGFASTTGDLARFAIAVMDHRLISTQSFEAMTDSLRVGDAAHPLAAGWAIGTGNWLDDRDALPGVIWAGGNIHGATSVIHMLPSRRTAVVVATNAQDHGTVMLRLADDLARVLARP